MCVVAGCTKGAKARGWCSMHYERWRRHGDPDWIPFSEVTIPMAQRFWAKVDGSGGDDACWPWTGAKRGKGYGTFHPTRRTSCSAHRVAYELTTGDYLDGTTQIDHICFNKACCNPRHLRPATNKQQRENLPGAQCNSRTGVRGVSMQGSRYKAVVGHNGRYVYLGMFASIEEADAAVREKRLELFTHNDADRSGAA